MENFSVKRLLMEKIKTFFKNLRPNIQLPWAGCDWDLDTQL